MQARYLQDSLIPELVPPEPLLESIRSESIIIQLDLIEWLNQNQNLSQTQPLSVLTIAHDQESVNPKSQDLKPSCVNAGDGKIKSCFEIGDRAVVVNHQFMQGKTGTVKEIEGKFLTLHFGEGQNLWTISEKNLMKERTGFNLGDQVRSKQYFPCKVGVIVGFESVGDYEFVLVKFGREIPAYPALERTLEIAYAT